MKRLQSLLLIPACATLSVSSGAQDPAAVQALIADDLRVPLHCAPDDPVGGAYGLWAAGPTYKASFHDGFAFYPYRGPDRPLVKFHWRTESVSWGGTELLSDAPVAHTGTWRHELRHGAVTEVYDVLPEGVEQSFVLPWAAGCGDVVVTGRIDTGLHAEPVGDAQQDLEFAEDGEAAVRYGRAVAFDAGGRRVPVTTSFDGTTIRLRLRAEFLAEAAFPVTIDPLTAPLGLSTGSTQVRSSAVAVDNSGVAGKVMVAFTRHFAAGDHDVYAVLCDRDFSNSKQVFFEITTTWDTREVDVAHVDGADRFAVAVQRDYGAGARRVRVYLHDDQNMALNSGTTLFPTTPRNMRWQKPRISGARGTGGHAMLVFEEESSIGTSLDDTRAMAMAIDAQVPGLGAPMNLDLNPSGFHDNERPAIVSSTVDKSSWLAMWRRRDTSIGGYILWAARIDANSVHQNHPIFGTTDAVDELAVAGSWDFGTATARYAAVWTRTTGTFQQELEIIRFDWGVAGTPTFLPRQTVAKAGAGVLVAFDDVDIAHDWRTRSHWAVTYLRHTIAGTSGFVSRLGHMGGVTESQTLHSSVEVPGALSVAFADSARQRFLLSYRVDWFGISELRGREFTYPADATTTIYGPTCALGSTISSNQPLAGHEFFEVEIQPVGWLEPALFIVGFAPASVPLGPFGFPPQCSLVVDLSTAVSVGFSNPYLGGKAFLQLPLPDVPLFIGDVFIQAAVFPPGATPFVTTGLGVQVR